MPRKPSRLHLSILSLLLMISLSACSKGAYIFLDYRLPAQPGEMAPRSVSVLFKDQRGTSEVLTPAAAKEYEHFTGIYSLSLKESEKRRIFLGTYELPSLFTAVFTKRLEETGLIVAPPKSGSAPVFEIVLKEFLIDLQGRDWIASIAYKVNLIQDDRVLTTQEVNGRGERLKVVGKKEAEQVLDEIFTETVNKLDIEKLFSDAKL